jgi:hypothetical protein
MGLARQSDEEDCMMIFRVGAASLFVLTLLSAPAAAEVILTPFVGTTFGAGARDDVGDTKHMIYGGTLTMVGDGVLGFELDGQYAPDFFGEADDSNVASLMGELIFGTHDAGSGLRFYAAAGGGLLKTRVKTTDQFLDLDRNAFGVTFGGSMIAKFGETFGGKADVRYFRGITDVKADNEVDLDLTGFHFWRLSAGLAIHF